MMMDDSATEALIEQATLGERQAREQLLIIHRDRLCHMVALRMDRRMAARIAPSDIVQDALAEADRHLSEYLKCRPLPFYPWLRKLAWERLVALRRQHVLAKRRSVNREEPWVIPVNDGSAIELADRLAANQSSPSANLTRDELRCRVQHALATLDPQDREILVLRFLEQMSTREAAAVLDITESGIKSRLMRALVRLRSLLENEKTGDPS